MLHLFYVLLWSLPFVPQSEIDVRRAVSTGQPKLYYMNSTKKQWGRGGGKVVMQAWNVPFTARRTTYGEQKGANRRY